MFDCFPSTQAETRAEFAERSVAKLEKTIDDLEGMNLFQLIFKHLKKFFCRKCAVTQQESTKNNFVRPYGFLLDPP